MKSTVYVQYELTGELHRKIKLRILEEETTLKEYLTRTITRDMEKYEAQKKERKK